MTMSESPSRFRMSAESGLARNTSGQLQGVRGRSIDSCHVLSPWDSGVRLTCFGSLYPCPGLGGAV